MVAFMGVNLCAIARYYVRGDFRRFRRICLNLLPPLLGFPVCLYIWLSLRTHAMIGGFIWLLLGLAYCAVRTNWFRVKLEFAGDPSDA